MFSPHAQVNIIDADQTSIWIDCCVYGRHWQEHGWPTSAAAIERGREILDLAETIETSKKPLPAQLRVVYFHECVSQSRPAGIGSSDLPTE